MKPIKLAVLLGTFLTTRVLNYDCKGFLCVLTETNKLQKMPLKEGWGGVGVRDGMDAGRR